MSKHQYFRGMTEISEAEALDHDGLLRDGTSMRVRTTMRDSDPWSETNPPTGFGSRGPRGAVEGDLCVLDGRAGRLRKIGSELRCVPTRPQHRLHRWIRQSVVSIASWFSNIAPTTRVKLSVTPLPLTTKTSRTAGVKTITNVPATNATAPASAASKVKICEVCNGEGFIPAASDRTADAAPTHIEAARPRAATDAIIRSTGK